MSCVCSLLLATVPSLASNAPLHSPTYAGLPFANLGGRELLLDLYIPTAGKRPYPVVIHIHAGAWQTGDRAPLLPLASKLLEQGFAVASVDYRLTTQAGQYGPYSVAFPAQIHDVKGAVRWLRANADEYQLDPDRFASVGASAGGHLAELLALSGGASELEGDIGGNLAFSSSVQAGVAYFGSSNLLSMMSDVMTPPGPAFDYDAPTSPESALLGWTGLGQGLGDIKAHIADPTPPYPELVKRAQHAAPVSWVDANDPPLFIAHGTLDTTVPVNQSTRLSAALYAAGVEHVLHPLPKTGHGFGQGVTGCAIDAEALAFLQAKFEGPAQPPVGLQSCFGDGSGTPCPCGNTSWSGARLGCKNSSGVGGSLTASGIASLAHDELTLHGNGMPNGSALYIQGAQLHAGGAGVVFGDGLQCVSTNVVRLGSKMNVIGSSQYPTANELPVSVRGGATAGSTLHYQIWYRDGSSYCMGSTWNLTNVLSVAWAP